MIPFLPYCQWILQSPPAIPKLYWDAYSQEERIKRICMHVEGLEQYLAYLSELLPRFQDELRRELIKIIEETQRELEAQMRELEDYIDEQVRELKEWVIEHTRAEGIWDVTTGATEDSVTAMRRLFFDVTVHGTTVDDLAESDRFQTVDALSDSGWNARALAVIGGYILDTQSDLEPWVVDPATAGDSLSVADLALTHIDDDGYVYVP